MILRSFAPYVQVHGLIDRMCAALEEAGIISVRQPPSRVFHYSMSPFTQILDGIFYVYGPGPVDRAEPELLRLPAAARSRGGRDRPRPRTADHALRDAAGRRREAPVRLHIRELATRRPSRSCAAWSSSDRRRARGTRRDRRLDGRGRTPLQCAPWQSSRPNIILIITDQQRFDTIAALGFPWVTTPSLDRLAREGVAFTNCFVTAPSCAPSRASLFTGYTPHTTGVFRNGDLWRHGWVEQLAAAGYRCVNVGKMHTTPFTAPMGFHERYVVENKDRYLEGRYFFDEWDKALAAHGLVKQQRELYRRRPDYRERLGAFEWELPEALHSDVFVGGLARWWIASYPRTEPLFLADRLPGAPPAL